MIITRLTVRLGSFKKIASVKNNVSFRNLKPLSTPYWFLYSLRISSGSISNELVET